MKTFLFLLYLLLLSSSSLAETITLKSGASFEGQIIELTEDYVVVDRRSKGTFRINFENISPESLDVLKSLPKIAPPVKPSPQNQEQTKPLPNTNSEKTAYPLSAQEIFTQKAASVVIITAQLDNGRSQGSGFIASPDGIIVTNAHVIAGANHIDVRTKDGRTFPVTDVIAYKPFRDLCLLKIDARDLPTATLTDSNKLKPGQTIFVIGAPLGYEYSITNGIFSATRQIHLRENLQFSAPISPGNSGGPVFDENGHVIGISTFILENGQNMNFAIPSNDIQPLLSTDNVTPKPINTFLSTHKNAAQDFSHGMATMNNHGAGAAIPIFEKALNNVPDMGDILIMLSSLNEIAGAPEKALTYAQKAVALNPQDPDAVIELGIAFGFNNQWIDAINVLNQSLTLKPGSRIVYLNLAVCYEKTDQLDKALEAIHKAIDISPFNDHIYLTAGWIYHRMGNTTAALELSEKALGLNPDNTQALLNLSAIHLAAGQKEKALSYAERYTHLGETLPENLAAQLGMPDRNPQTATENVNTADLIHLAQLSEETNDFEASYKYSLQALANTSTQNKEDFLIAYDTLRRGMHLASGYYQLAWENPDNKDAAKRAFDLAIDNIDIIEKWGGLPQIIAANKKFRSILGFNPGHKNDIDHIFTAGYFIYGILSANKDISLSCYNAIKDYTPDKAKMIIEVISIPGN